MRSKIIGMTLTAAFVAAGAAADWWCLIGIGVWLVIAAFLMEMIYRP
ncbi:MULTISPECIES: hypothetical protein [Streptomyces]|uniref:Integral membrane protein n=1 Tax=Streptomyces changanensis TaxID=2964669 RepID=A0ABY5ND23_9ACTN|nr:MULTISPECIES: hypothetical protein [Streptomyces]UUS33920.1 hypothetical protein NRO40_25915 [Streptomyces changanensis]